MTIYKYEVQATDQFQLTIPGHAVFLSVQTQRGIPQMWWLVDPLKPLQMRCFRVIGTGYQIEDIDTLEYLGTFQMHDGNYDFHLFEMYTNRRK